MGVAGVAPSTPRRVAPVPWTGWIAAAVGLAVAVSACTPGVRRPAVDTDPGNPAITDAQRNLAMMTVHAYARYPHGDFLGAEFLTLREAVDILGRDTGMRAESRVRRAIAKLLAYSYPAESDEDIRADAAARLLAGRTDAHERPVISFRMLMRQIALGAAAAIPPIPIPPPPERLAEFEALIANLLQGVTPHCPYVIWVSAGIGKPPPVAWRHELWVPRRMEDVARSLDPQHWAEASTLFYASYRVSTPSCCPKLPASNCSFTVAPKTHDPVPGPACAGGQAYPWTAFFERFCIGKACPSCPGSAWCQVAFDNLLCTRTQYDQGASVPLQCLAAHADRYDVSYHFATFLFGEINGNELGNDIDADSGSLWVRRPTSAEQQATLPAGVWSYVHVDKVLSFKDEGVTIGVGKILLETYHDELAGQIAEQACYEVPEECWLGSCP
jgi:hypothetical protein